MIQSSSLRQCHFFKCVLKNPVHISCFVYMSRLFIPSPEHIDFACVCVYICVCVCVCVYKCLWAEVLLLFCHHVAILIVAGICAMWQGLPKTVCCVRCINEFLLACCPCMECSLFSQSRVLLASWNTAVRKFCCCHPFPQSFHDFHISILNRFHSLVHAVQENSSGLKLSNSWTTSNIMYSCHHNLSCL